MKIHIFQHVHFEGPGYISEWAEKHQHTLTFTKFDEAYSIPFPSDIDFLIVLGGPMSVDESKTYPWICDERDYIYQMAKTGCKILGICFGAQMISSALGMEVFPNKVKEIGWFPIQKDPVVSLDLFRNFPDELLAFHWHSDTFEIPGRANRLFFSEACENQGFILARHVFALQFHWEVTRESVQQMLNYCADDLEDSKYVQSAEELLEKPEYFTIVNSYMEQLLDYIAQL